MWYGDSIGNAFFEDEGFLPSYFSMVIIYLAVLIPLAAIVSAVFLILLSDTQAGLESPTGCSPVGLRDGRSNLTDERTPQHQTGSRDESAWRVKSLWIYPIKSCRGVELASSSVVGTGLLYDRQFCFARLLGDAADGAASTEKQPWRFITQREYRLLSQVRTELWLPDPKRPAYRADLPYVQSGGAVVVSFPWQQPGWRGAAAALSARVLGGSPPRKSFAVPFQPTPEQLRREYGTDRFTIWQETVTAVNMGTHVPPELRRFIGCSQPLTLMRVGANREVFRAAPRKEDLGWQPVTGFADAYPIHLLGLASVAEVERRQPEGSPSLTGRRFRANVYTEGTPAFEEDEWKRIRIGTYGYRMICRCVRCTMPNIEPDTGTRHLAQPRKTLLATRAVDKGAPGEGCLGMNICPELQKGQISVGDRIEVLETGEQFYIKM